MVGEVVDSGHTLVIDMRGEELGSGSLSATEVGCLLDAGRTGERDLADGVDPRAGRHAGRVMGRPTIRTTGWTSSSPTSEPNEKPRFSTRQLVTQPLRTATHSTMTVLTGVAVVLAVVLLLNGVLVAPAAGALVAVALIGFGVYRVIRAKRADR